jgi:hypothetical protein
MLFVSALLAGVWVGFLGDASPASAADDVAISTPANGAVVAPVPDSAGAPSVVITGTQHPTETSTLGAYLDGIFLKCTPDTPVGPNGYGMCFIAPAPSPALDGTWTLSLSRHQFELFGRPFGGAHTVDVVLLDHPDVDGPYQEIGRASVSFTVDAPGGSATSVSRLASGEPDAPSTLSATVAMQDTGLDPQRTALTAIVTIILLLIVGYPGTLLGSALGDEKNYERLFGGVTRTWRKVTASVPRPKAPGWVPVAAGMTLATIIAGFVDPGFGFNLGSLRVLASVAIAFVIQNILGWWLVRRALRITDPDLAPHVRFRFGSLVILLLAVLVSRLVGFEPGMVFGLLVGLSFGVELAAAKQARVALVGAGYAFGLAMVGWLGYSLITGVVAAEPGFWAVFASETLSGLAVSGIAALPLALLPIAFVEGGAIFAWRKSAWAIAYGVGLFAFFVILLPLPFSWGEVGLPLATWVGLYLAYAVLAIVVWGWFRFTKAPATKGS